MDQFTLRYNFPLSKMLLYKMDSHDKTAVIISFLVSLSAAFYLMFGNIEKLLIQDGETFIVKYFGLIMLINLSISLFVLELLITRGYIHSYFSLHGDEINKAKLDIIITILSLPLWLTTSILCFGGNIATLNKIGWALVMFYVVFTVTKSVNRLTNRSTTDAPKRYGP